jgi:hypothetical protein
MFRKRLQCLGISLFATVVTVVSLCPVAEAQVNVPYKRPTELWSVPKEIASTHFTVTIEGKTTPVMHAALNDYFLNFEGGPKLEISVTADKDDYWKKGVEVQPWRLGIRPTIEGRTIKFILDGPQKISISRPGDFLSQAEMLYLFANEREATVPLRAHPGLQYFGPGVYHQNLNAVSGGNIYLAPGAVVFGGLNIWGEDHVKVFGRGVIVYDGPQNPANDDGYMHKKNWHCITMDNAHDVIVEGITCVVRSRTWQIQMKGTQTVRFDNIKVIGANAGNANADGMDWLDGSGNTIVTNSFFRAADDVFALQDSWEGYGPVAFAVDGKPVSNIRVDTSVLSTSISNIVRAGWPGKSFRGGHFRMEDSDIIHGGIGGCGIPFAVMEIWADPDSRGKSGDFAFSDVRMDDWYSLVNVEQQPVEGVSDVTFQDIFGMESPSTVPSVLKGHVHGVVFDNVLLGGTLATRNSDIPVKVYDGADQPKYEATGPVIRIVDTSGLVQPHKYIKLEAMLEDGDAKDMIYTWTFGDGTTATGPKIEHEFPDTDGTLHDGSGRFRVLLHGVDAKGRNGWAYDPVVVANALKPAHEFTSSTEDGLHYRYLEMDAPELDALAPKADGSPNGVNGVSTTFSVTQAKARGENYAIEFDGYVDVPADGGYTFTMMSNDAGKMMIDGALVATAKTPFPQFCGSVGNAVQSVMGSVALAKGKHRILVEETHTTGVDGFKVLWQRPGTANVEIPPDALSHVARVKGVVPTE